MWKCYSCGKIFDEPDVDRINAEDYYGVSGLFNNYNYIDINLCPHCNSDEIEETYIEEEDEN